MFDLHVAICCSVAYQLMRPALANGLLADTFTDVIGLPCVASFAKLVMVASLAFLSLSTNFLHHSTQNLKQKGWLFISELQ